MKFCQTAKILFFISCFVSIIFAQDPTPTPSPTPGVVGEVTITATKANIDPGYQELRKGSDETTAFSGEYATVSNLVIKRDQAIFTLKSGEIYFLKPILGKRTGAVFIGEGELSLTPPVEIEKQMLKFFTEATEVKEGFTQLVMFFTDNTFDEIKASPNVKMSTAGAQAGRARDEYREKEGLLKTSFKYNMTTRLLMDFYAPLRPGFFTTFIDGKKYNKLFYQLDPLGIADVSPEQVMLYNYGENGIWTAFHLANEYTRGTANNNVDRRIFDLTKHEIDITLRGAKLFASDKVTMKPLVSGQRVLPFDLFPFLRVKRVTDENQKELDIVQEDKNRDGSLAIILPVAPEVGKSFSLNFEYEGDSAVINRGSGNFILVPRSTWYPNNGGTQFGDRAVFDITFRYPKQLIMVGVGEMAEPEKTEGDLKISKWSTKDVEMAVAGFNYGDFLKKEVKDEVTGYTLEVYANRDVPDEIKGYQRMVEEAQANGQRVENTLSSFTTTGMSSYMLGETQNSTRIYHAYFGKLPFSRIAMTQQPVINFGQAWPTLIYMPYPAFVGSSMRTQLLGNSQAGSDGFWTEVGPHEVAHQWWGHATGWTSYHDQWMSEGFSQLATSLYIQFVKKDLKAFNEFWEGERKLIIEATPATRGLKPYTVGPITQGYRLNTAKTGNIARRLIYPKGAYVLHMLRMMMMDRKEGDNKFQLMMRDFVKTHYNEDVSTEDFKRIVEKHMTPIMDIDKNGKMDWFFNQWVYGTEVPEYKLEYSVTKSGEKYVLSGGITQSGVSKDFVMVVPLYLDFGNGWTTAGNVTLVGNTRFDLGNIQLPREPKKVAICALSDVLATKIDNVKK